jgi:adenine-specific DNA-methyltransferase
MVMNGVFGEENFIGAYIWKNKAGGGGKQSSNKPGAEKKEAFVLDHEYIIVYAKDINETIRFSEKLTAEEVKEYTNPDNDPRGPYKLGSLEMMMPQPISTMYYEMKDPDGIILKPKGGRHMWRFSKERTMSGLKDGSVLWVKVRCDQTEDKRGYRYVLKTKQYLYNEGKERTKISRSLLLQYGLSADGTREIMEMFDQDKTQMPIFSNPKPTTLMRYLISCVGTENEIILDFFAGSGTTAQAVLEQNAEDRGNRRFILVQLPEPTPEDSEARKAGYKTISEICRERVRRAIKKIKKDKELDLGFKAFTLVESNFKAWKGVEGKDAKKYTEQMALYVDPLKPKWKIEDVIWEVALKEGFGLYSKIEKLAQKENTIYKVTEPQKQQSFLICLDGDLKASAMHALNLKKEDVFICRDVALSDELAANLALQCRLKTI